ncbi:MAG: hypothetical protein WKF34_00865 [Pyrinomonadaceae bacterium]
MLFQNLRRFVIFIAVILGLMSANIYACGCVGMPNEKIEAIVLSASMNSSTVFSGKVTGTEYRKGIPLMQHDLDRSEKWIKEGYETMVVKFDVDRWWKGDFTSNAFLVTGNLKRNDGITQGNSCEYNFKTGSSYLVFATGGPGERRTHACALTREMPHADAIIKELGPGRLPIETEPSDRVKP